MRFNRPVILPLVAATLLLALTGCRTLVPVRDVEDDVLQPRGDATLADVDEAIWRAGRRLGWDVETEKPGHSLIATYRPRVHVAVVRITHDGDRFSIHYVSSENVKYDHGKIHPNYNVWVARLANAIRLEPIRPRRVGPR